MLTVDDLVIDPELSEFFDRHKHTPLQIEELEKLICKYGYDEIKHWHGKVVEGHTRYCIWERLHKGKADAPEVPLKEMHFKNIEEAKEFIVANQLARRNVDEKSAKYYRGRMAKAMLPASNAGQPEGHVHNNGHPVPKTKRRKGASELAAKLGVHRSTLNQDEKFHEAVESLKRRGVVTGEELLNGDAKVTTIMKASQATTKSDAKKILDGKSAPRLSETAKRFSAPLRMLQILNREFPWRKFPLIEAEIKHWSEEASSKR